MLLWEAISNLTGDAEESTTATHAQNAGKRVRLPFDKQCLAITKSGKRCQGRILPHSEFCLFHDPDAAEKRKSRLAGGGRRRNPLSHLPDGYLRKLTSRAAVGQAMDRLYREVRLGIVTPEMGKVLFALLTRILDSGLCNGRAAPLHPSRTKAERLRPKLIGLLSSAERAAWRKAVANAPPRLLYKAAEPSFAGEAAVPGPVPEPPALARVS